MTSLGLRLAPWQMVEREPLYDLDDTFLGFSCRIVIVGLHEYDTKRLWDDLGITEETRGLDICGPPHGHGAQEIMWFQPA